MSGISTAVVSDETERIRELIHRRRRQVLVHSVIYYEFGTTVVDDATYDSWARELGSLQRDYPELSESVEYHLDAFRGFIGTTGFNLPLRDLRAHSVARRLLAYGKRSSSRL